jgi:hypothetical protein
MNKESEKEVDDLFKKKLEEPVHQAAYREEDWGALEKMLGKHQRKKGIIYLLPVLSGVAALLLLFWGWWAFRQQAVPHKNKISLAAVNHIKQTNTGTNGGAKRQPANQHTQIPLPENLAANQNGGKNSSVTKSLLPSSAAATRRTAGSTSTETGVKSVVDNIQGEALSASMPSAFFEPEQIIAQPVSAAGLIAKTKITGTALPPNRTNVGRVRAQTGYRPQFALTVLAAPDINGVGSFQQGKVGTNVGMQFSVGISKKLTITAGTFYSIKPYITGFGNYHTPYQFQVAPTNVTADCRMLDIPLNIGYQFYNKQQNKISIGTGLSSYIMLHENYKFNYADVYATGPLQYTVPNSNKYFFGVLNLNATYERRLNSKVGLTVEPYLKLPLTNIGYSQVRLQTTGIAVGLTWNFNSIIKP